jgi:hypothetical protein
MGVILVPMVSRRRAVGLSKTRKEDGYTPGIGISVVLFAVGAILDFAVTVGPDQHGFNIHNVGVILMIVSSIGFVVALLAFGFGGSWGGTRRHRAIVDDGQGNVMRREDISQ